jgi:hypothetical protein
MIDIVLFDKEKGDSLIVNTDVYKADNLLRIQTGSLMYAVDFGIDLNYFLNPAFEIENDVFINYLQQRISEFSMNVGDLKRVTEEFREKALITINSNETAGSKTRRQ